jgi:hypothetical protein
MRLGNSTNARFAKNQEEKRKGSETKICSRAGAENTLDHNKLSL